MYLKINEFKWVTDEEIKGFHVRKIYNTLKLDYSLKIDPEYPENLYKMNNHYPLIQKNCVTDYIH